jgi:hypothetical protein
LFSSSANNDTIRAKKLDNVRIKHRYNYKYTGLGKLDLHIAGAFEMGKKIYLIA